MAEYFLKKYQKLDYDDFIRNYDIELIKQIKKVKNENYWEWYVSEDKNNTKPKEYSFSKTELSFLIVLGKYLYKRFNTLNKYAEHCEKIGKKLFYSISNESLNHDTKMLFLEFKWGKINQTQKFKTVYNKTSTVTNKRKNLINGIKPNITERYKIANEVLDIYKNINSKNISATEKHKLLAHIMGCNQQTARELFNGTQLKRTSVRDEIINPYLDTLK